MAPSATTRRYRVDTDDSKQHELEAEGYQDAFAKLEQMGYPLARLTSLWYWHEADKWWESADDLLSALKPDRPATSSRTRGQYTVSPPRPAPADTLPDPPAESSGLARGPANVPTHLCITPGPSAVRFVLVLAARTDA